MWMLSLAVLAVAALEPTAVVGDAADLPHLLAAIYQAVASGDWVAVASAGVVLMVALSRRYLGGRVPFLMTKLGGVALVAFWSFFGAGLTALASGHPLTWGLALTALKVGVIGTGGRALLQAVRDGALEQYLRPPPAVVAAEVGAAAGARAKSSPQAAADELGSLGR